MARVRILGQFAADFPAAFSALMSAAAPLWEGSARPLLSTRHLPTDQVIAAVSEPFAVDADHAPPEEHAVTPGVAGAAQAAAKILVIS
jgi:hypothetical protein